MSGFHFFHDLNLVVSEFGEDIDDEGLLDQLLATYDHPDFRPGMDELISFLPTRTSRVSADGLREIARSFPRRSDRGARPNRVAVVTRSKLGRGLGRLYGAYADREGQVTLEVFGAIGDAADWLDEARGRARGTTRRAIERALGWSV